MACLARLCLSHGSCQPRGAIPGQGVLTWALRLPISQPCRAAGMDTASSGQTWLPSAPLPLPGHQLLRFETTGSQGHVWVVTGPAKGLRGPVLPSAPRHRLLGAPRTRPYAVPPGRAVSQCACEDGTASLNAVPTSPVPWDPGMQLLADWERPRGPVLTWLQVSSLGLELFSVTPPAGFPVQTFCAPFSGPLFDRYFCLFPS